MDRHLVEALIVDDELEKVEKFAHRVAILVRQQQAQHGDGPRLVLSWES